MKKMKDYLPEDRPREKLLRYGARALSNSDLLAILLGSGTGGKNVLSNKEKQKHMRKILAIIAGMLAVASCRPPESTFSAQNVADYFTYKDGTLYNDYGNTFAITQDNTDGKWKVDGGRMYAIFDILNAQLDIVLKQYLSGTIKAHSGVVDKENLPAGDPVVISDCNIGGGYLNVMLTYYYKEGTDCPHDTRLLYDDDGQTLRLYLVHDGAGENPVAMDKEAITAAASGCMAAKDAENYLIENGL